MFALIGIQNILSTIVIVSAAVIILALILKLLKQPSVISYILAGAIMGPYGLEIVQDTSQTAPLGSLGLILLLFFVGMEISLPSLIANWKISVIGTLMQIIISLIVVYFLGHFAGWTVARIVMLGFVLSLSSTAVVLKLLEEWKETHTKIGQNVIGILLAQDILIVVMLIVMSYLGGEEIKTSTIVLQLIGASLIAVLMIVILKKKTLKVPYELKIVRDHELQVFVAFLFCFGFALIAELMHLSSALGAFIGGIIVSATRSTHWIQNSLHAFRIIFVSIFFVYIGMVIDIQFMIDNIGTIFSLVISVLVLNTLINGFVFLSFKIPWRQSFYGGAILSQIGEFSFVLGEAGFSLNIINQYTYQLILSTIAITLLLSPIWIYIIKKMLRCTPASLDPA